jgi:hypothetical protein
MFFYNDHYEWKSTFPKRCQDVQTIIIFDSTFRAYCKTLCDRNKKLFSGINERVEGRLVVSKVTKECNYQFNESAIYIDETLYELSPFQCHKMLNICHSNETNISGFSSTTCFSFNFLKYLFQNIHKRTFLLLLYQNDTLSFQCDIMRYIRLIKNNITQLQKNSKYSTCETLCLLRSFLICAFSWYKNGPILQETNKPIDTNFLLTRMKTMQLTFCKKYLDACLNQQTETSEIYIKRLKETRDSITDYFQYQISECSSNYYRDPISFSKLNSMDTQESYHEEFNGTYTESETTHQSNKCFLSSKTIPSLLPYTDDTQKDKHKPNFIVQMPYGKEQMIEPKCSNLKKQSFIKNKNEKSLSIMPFVSHSYRLTTLRGRLSYKSILFLMRRSLITYSHISLKNKNYLNLILIIKKFIFFSKLIKIRLLSKKKYVSSSVSRILSNLVFHALFNCYFFDFKHLSKDTFLKWFIKLTWITLVINLMSKQFHFFFYF